MAKNKVKPFLISLIVLFLLVGLLSIFFTAKQTVLTGNTLDRIPNTPVSLSTANFEKVIGLEVEYRAKICGGDIELAVLQQLDFGGVTFNLPEAGCDTQKIRFEIDGSRIQNTDCSSNTVKVISCMALERVECLQSKDCSLREESNILLDVGVCDVKVDPRNNKCVYDLSKLTDEQQQKVEKQVDEIETGKNKFSNLTYLIVGIISFLIIISLIIYFILRWRR